MFTRLNVQRKFLKYSSFKIDGVFPVQGIPYRLIERHNILPLNTRRKTASVAFLSKLLHSRVVWNVLVQKINIRLPRVNTRSTVLHCKKVN